MVELTAELLGGLNQVLHSLASRIRVSPQSLVFSEWGGPTHTANVIKVCAHLIGALSSIEGGRSLPPLSSLDEVNVCNLGALPY
ncbi:hypothetical protein EON65_50710 [archaeon]|nr:MAG: hypothetical protein EON65_50710 [archaeon]